MEKGVMNFFLALDQLGNAILGGAADETISSVLGKKIIENKVGTISKVLIKLLDLIDDNHSIDAIEWDEGRTFADMFGPYKNHRKDGKH